MKRIRLIGILGRARVGKDTVAEFLLEALPDARIWRISQPIKDAARILYGFTQEQVEGPCKECKDPRHGITPREAIQGLSEYGLQAHGPAFFSKFLFDRVDSSQHPVIIPDIRYAHDVREIQKRGGIVIKVSRPYHPEVPLHPWEAHIQHLRGDIEIFNDHDPSVLRERVHAALSQIVNSMEPNHSA